MNKSSDPSDLDQQIETLAETADRCPFGYYDKIRDRGEIFWDDAANAWLAPSFDSTRAIYVEEDLFVRPKADAVAGPEFARIVGPGHAKSLQGADRSALRRWWLGLFKASTLDSWRSGVVSQVIDYVIGEFEGSGVAELESEYATPLAIRMIAAILGMPWEDAEWLRRVSEPLDRIEHFRNTVYADRDRAAPQAALDATFELDEIFKPFEDAARRDEGDGILRKIWNDPDLDKISVWGEEERLGLVRTFFGAGRDTIRTSLTNTLFLVLSQRELIDGILDGGRDVARAIVEESLRLYGSVQFRVRTAVAETTLLGPTISQGGRVIAMNSSANRDPARYPRPAAVDLERPNLRQHLAFSVGSSACVGSAFARLELQEGLLQLVNRLPDLEFADGAEPPSPKGLSFRIFSPLNIRFTPPA